MRQGGNPKVKRYFQAVERLMATSRTLNDIFDISTLSFPKIVYAEYFDANGRHREIRYRDLRSACFILASQMMSRLISIPKGSIVGLKLKNSPDWAVVFWALLMNGYTPFLLDSRASGEASDHFLKQADAKAIIAEDFHTYSLPRFTLQDIRDEKPNYSFDATWADRVIFASSGTTGDAKLVVFDGENLVHQINAAFDMPNTTANIMYPPSLGNLKILAFIPFHHIFGFVAVFLWYTFFGKTIVFLNEWTPKEIQNTCRKLRVSHVYAVPLFWDNIATNLKRTAALQGPERVELLEKMIAFRTVKISQAEAGIAGTNIALRKLQKKLLGNHIRYCISGGGALARETLETLNGIGYPLYNGYGMTEVGVTSVELVPDVLQRLKNSIGKPLHGVVYKIIPSDPEKPTVGELYIQSPTIHKYEIKNRQIVPTVLKDGFFATGDIAESDKAGNYWIRGRIKDIIINPNGENVYPEEIETHFKSIPHTKNCAVIGISAASARERIVLVLELLSSPTPEQIEAIKTAIKDVNVTLPQYKQIETTYVTTEKLPLSSTLKVQKFILRDWLHTKKDLFQALEEARFSDFDPYPSELIDDLLKQVRSLFSNALVLPESSLSDAGHFVNDFGGDSLSYTELIAQMEETFGITFNDEVFGQLASINDFVIEVAKYKTKQGS